MREKKKKRCGIGINDFCCFFVFFLLILLIHSCFMPHRTKAKLEMYKTIEVENMTIVTKIEVPYFGKHVSRSRSTVRLIFLCSHLIFFQFLFPFALFHHVKKRSKIVPCGGIVKPIFNYVFLQGILFINYSSTSCIRVLFFFILQHLCIHSFETFGFVYIQLCSLYTITTRQVALLFPQFPIFCNGFSRW